MVDLKKIDSFFEKEEPDFARAPQHTNRRARCLRLIKLIMPSIAAVLVALILIFPSMKKNNTLLDYDLTIPKKGELEKLHVENTVFSTTDKDGKISSFTADEMNETTPGSKIIEMNNPKGQVAVNAEGKFIDVVSQTGFYHQADNIVVLQGDVKAVYDKETTLETQQGEYDFEKAYAHGNEPILAFGSWGRLTSESFAYDKRAEKLYLNGKTKIEHEDQTLYANKQVIYDKKNNQLVAIGRVKVEQQNGALFADKVVMYLTDDKKPKAKKIDALGDVVVESGGAVAKGEKGVYYPNQDKVELEGQVCIQKDGHVIYGSKAISDLKTKRSYIVSAENKKRVSGMISGRKIKRSKNEKK